MKGLSRRVLWGLLTAAVLIIVVFAVSGSFPKNPKLGAHDPGAGYRYDRLDPGDKNTDSLFVVLAFSGGGTRAAAFSYGVLEALNRTEIQWKGVKKRLLDEVDMISSVSGGSFTAAYYALNRQGIFDGRFEREFLKKNIEKQLVYQLFFPVNWPNLAGGSYGRSDLVAEYWDEHLFHHASFQTLLDKGTRPYLMVNATDMSTGTQFPFIQDQMDLICSDLAGLPIARAVAASSAFPGLLTPLTFQSYAGACGYEPPKWVESRLANRHKDVQAAQRGEIRQSYYGTGGPRRNYLHLVDGGVSDNLGLRSILHAMQSPEPPYSIQRMINNEVIEKLVIIVVNAATYEEPQRDQTDGVPNIFDLLVASATIPLSNYTYDTLQMIRHRIDDINSAVRIREQCNSLMAKNGCPTRLPDNLYTVDLYLSHLTFDAIRDDGLRHQFRSLPTNFNLDSEAVDQLRGMGATLLRQTESFRQLMGEIGMN